MFAVIKTGGKQYKVAPNDVLKVERLPAEAGESISIDQVLMVGEDGQTPQVGAPVLKDARVTAEVVEHTRGNKIRVFKKKRRKGYRRTHGHRQDLTVLRVTDIAADGIAKAKGAKPAAKKKAAAKGDAAAKADAQDAKAAEDAARTAPGAETETRNDE